MNDACDEHRAGWQEREPEDRSRGFRAVTPALAILRGGSSTSDRRFQLRSRTGLATAAAAVALVYAQLLEPADWTGELLDRVLRQGERLLRASQARLRLGPYERVAACQLQRELYLGDYKCSVRAERVAPDGEGPAEALRAFFREQNFAVLTSEGTAVGVWRRPGCGFFYFEPAAADERGRRLRDAAGVACLVRSAELGPLLELLLAGLRGGPAAAFCLDKLVLLGVRPVAGDRYHSRDAAQLVLDEKLLRSLNATDAAASRLECASPARPGSPERRFMREVAAAPGAAEDRSAACASDAPLLDENGAALAGLRVNVPTTFSPLPHRLAILRGRKRRAEEAGPGRASASCVVAIATARVRPVRSWLRESLDEILATAEVVCAEVTAGKASVESLTAADFDGARVKLDDGDVIVRVDLLTVLGTVLSKKLTVVSLRQGVAEFFLNHADGVLECSSRAVAIWTEDDYYYLFDCQACDAVGLPVAQEKAGKKGKHGEGGKEKVGGKCCVVRFEEAASLCEHFLKSLDARKSEERFTIRHVTVLENVPGVCDWYSFNGGVLGSNWVLRGNISADDEFFAEHSRGHQGLAMHVAALVSAKTIAPPSWSKVDVDEAVYQGDAYYNWCSPAKDEVEEDDKILSLRRLKRHLYYKKCKVPIEVMEYRVNGRLKADFDDELFNLERGIAHFFENWTYGVVEANNKYFAIWSFEEELRDKTNQISYYLYHDKPNEQFLKQTLSDYKKAQTSACVVRFLDVVRLANVLKEQLHGEEENNKDEFYIHEIQVGSLSEPMTDEEITKDKATPIRPELRAYTAIGESGAFLAASFNQKNEAIFKKDTRDKQQAANALVTLAMTKLFNPYLWSQQVVNDILKIADRITEQNLKNLPELEEEDLEYTRTYLMPNEIANNFSLGVNQFTVDVEEDNTSDKLSELPKSLESFFSMNKMGIFRVGQIMLSIWREENIFFTMDPRGKPGGNAAVYWYLDAESLAKFLLECSGTTESEFIIDNVSIENRYEEVERSTIDFVTEDKWYNFSKIADGTWQIDGMVSMKNESFPEKDGKKQSAAICIIAIVFSKVYEPRQWTAEILNEIMITGEKLHARNVVQFGEDKSFHPKEIMTEFFLANRRIELSIHDCVEAGRLRSQEPRVQNITTGISKFFEQSTSGCITFSESKSIAIWKDDNFFYCFKPEVSLTRFANDSLLSEHLLRNDENDTDFEMTNIDVVDWNKLPPWKFDPSSTVRPANLPPLNAYHRLSGKARAALRGFTHEASEVFPEDLRGRQTASNCIIALAMSIIKNPIMWTRKTLDEILTLGTQLHRESFKLNTKGNTLKPKDIVRIFHIGVNVLTVDVEEATVIGIVAHPPPEPEDKKGGKKKSTKRKSTTKGRKAEKSKRPRPPPLPPLLLEEGLNKFFQNNSAGILLTGRYMIAIWKHNGVYFMYDPKSRDNEGAKFDNDSEGASCVIWFACKEPLYDLISQNINDDEKFSQFEICKIIIKIAPIESLPLPAGYKAIDKYRPNTPVSTCPNPPILASDLKENQSNEQDVDLQTSFEYIDEDLSILIGKSYMSHCQFPAENRGYQSSAIAAVAIVVAVLNAPSTWTISIIDAILKYGDILHTDCAHLLQSGSRNLSPSELLSVFIVGDVRATISIQRNVTAGIMLEYDLTTALNLFFSSNSFGIMHTATYAVPVMKYWGTFYFLDPSDRNRFRKESSQGAASLIKCENLPKLAKIIVQVCAFKEPTVYTLSAVQVLDLYFLAR